MIPIFKDTFYTTIANTLQYYITDGANTIFSGKAYRYPNDTNINININRICQNHLNSEIPNSVWSSNNGNVNLPEAIKTFYLFNSEGTQLQSYEFINDWSYGTTATTLSNPINGRYAANQYVFSSRVNNGKVNVAYAKSGNLCGDYAIYYSNLRGGWDSFLIEGKVIEKKDIEQFSYKKHINNNNIERSNVRFQSNINPNWEINTGWLSDSQSKILYDNLLTSNNVYLHNLKTDEIIPVTIQDLSVTNKQFKNERGLISYKINLKADNNRIRK